MTQKKKQPSAASKAVVQAAKPALNAAKKAGQAGELFFFPAMNGKPDKAMENFMNQNKAQMEKFTSDASAMGKESMEAFMKSSTLFAKGFEDIMKAAAGIAQSAAEKQGAFFKQALSSKTLNEWSEVQNKMAQANFDDFMAGATQLSEMSVKLLTEAAEPLSEQMTKAMSKASTAASAA